jgi:hypothetical protein
MAERGSAGNARTAILKSVHTKDALFEDSKTIFLCFLVAQPGSSLT